jgi:hypothetical protein
METADKEKFAIALLDMINKKREEVKTLTSEIIALENDPKNVVKIKQNIQSIINAVASCSNSDSNDLEIIKLDANIIFKLIRMSKDNYDDHTIKPRSWQVLVTHRLEDFCIYANAWNPIKYDFNKKGWRIDFKNLNLSIININK